VATGDQESEEAFGFDAYCFFSDDGQHVVTNNGVFEAAIGKFLGESGGPEFYDWANLMPEKFLRTRPFIPIILPLDGQHAHVELYPEFWGEEDEGVARLIPASMRVAPRLFRIESQPGEIPIVREKHDLDLEEHAIFAVQLSGNRSRLITAELDGRVRLWDAETGKHLCTLYSLSEDEWAVVDRAGRFDASNGGSVDELHWVIDSETIELEQLKDRYYEPGLLPKLLGNNDEPLRDVSAFDKPALFPRVEVVALEEGPASFQVTLHDRGGGIGKVVVKLNGKEVSADARQAGLDPKSSVTSFELDLADDPRLAGGADNVLEVQAFKEEGYLRSRGVVVLFDSFQETAADRPALHAVIVAVSDYRGDAIDLRYAAKDAEDFAFSLDLAAGELFGKDHVSIDLLTSFAGDQSGLATRRNLIDSLQGLADRCQSQDIAVIYLDGHGVSYGGPNGDFYY